MTISRKTIESIARIINKRANKDYNAYMIGKDESFALAKAAIQAFLESDEMWELLKAADESYNYIVSIDA